jgi:hypothetical protein
MLIVEILGGLGNQLFQYSFGRQLAKRHNKKLKLDITGFENYHLHQFSLNHFNIDADFATKEEIKEFKPIDQRLLCKWIFSLKRRAGMTRIFKEAGFHFQPEALHFPNTGYITGYWQSEKYFKDYEALIRNDLRFKTAPDSQNQEWSRIILNENSISLHIRRGDYITDPKAKQVHGFCDLDYYYRSIARINQEIKNPFFFIFSDDPEWVKENLQIAHPHLFVSNNDSTKNYEDMRLMSICKHNIIANSSFSWWGAWLNSHPGKMVIAPQKWFNTKDRNANDLVPDEWIKL